MTPFFGAANVVIIKNNSNGEQFNLGYGPKVKTYHDNTVLIISFHKAITKDWSKPNNAPGKLLQLEIFIKSKSALCFQTP